MSVSSTKKKKGKICREPKELPQAPQMKKFLGQPYILDHSENYEEFLRELGVKKSIRLLAMNSKPTVVLTQEDNQYVLSTSYPEGRDIKFKFRPDKLIKRLNSFTLRASSVFRFLDNKLLEEQTTGDKTIRIEREFKKNELVVTMEVNNVKCFRWYTRLGDSKESINTETSRRSLLWREALEASMHSSKKQINVTPEPTLIVEDGTDDKVCY